MIEQTTAKIINWPYDQYPPRVHNFIEWYEDVAREVAEVGSLDDLQDEIFDCAIMRKRVDQLTPGAYWIWQRANRTGKLLKECTDKEIEARVKRYYDKLSKELLAKGPGILAPPPPLIARSEQKMAEQKAGTRKRPEGWKVSTELERGKTEMEKIRRILK